jgi:ABC-type branched-subunit amino acid transport system substrate-binding protein
MHELLGSLMYTTKLLAVLTECKKMMPTSATPSLDHTQLPAVKKLVFVQNAKAEWDVNQISW